MIDPILSNSCGSVYEEHAVMHLKKNSIDFLLKEMESIHLKSTFNGKLPMSVLIMMLVLLILPVVVLREFGVSTATITFGILALLLILFLFKIQIKYYIRVAYKDGRKWKIIIPTSHRSEARNFIKEVRRQRPQIREQQYYFPTIDLKMFGISGK